ncbi:hypothetical protein CDD80_4107 [Ophiocordyceps camponoti-rufipedis]|uniref:UDP-N-acetylglucosamine transferase subunit ALG14 n=1 Tax=Ophiocordyceps camponoti-rufipedis TaxID=2004952 RepID=A0A2C5YZ01_9HYPO|nr:hypothetical protein CDD80_4107 [Ophiocordyceps camponoti-rufipedis]
MSASAMRRSSGPAAASLAAGLFIVRLSPQSILVKTSLAVAIAIAIFVTLLRHRRFARWPSRSAPVVPAAQRPDYHLFVLGSGGHTKEMLMMMDDGFCGMARLHRRYLLSSGDRVSRHQLEDYEARLTGLCCDAGTEAGTYDVRTVIRARRVHQSLLTTPLTALASVAAIVSILLSPPANATGRAVKLPTLVFSNGPGTGFCVALAVHLLKVFCVVPDDVMRFVYIESWARISSLSLTARLLRRLGIADALYVQHAEVAAKYGLPCAGEMVLNARRLED